MQQIIAQQKVAKMS